MGLIVVVLSWRADPCVRESRYGCRSRSLRPKVRRTGSLDCGWTFVSLCKRQSHGVGRHTADGGRPPPILVWNGISLLDEGFPGLIDRSQLSLGAATCHDGTLRCGSYATKDFLTLTADRKAIHAIIMLKLRFFSVLRIHAFGNHGLFSCPSRA